MSEQPTSRRDIPKSAFSLIIPRRDTAVTPTTEEVASSHPDILKSTKEEQTLAEAELAPSYELWKQNYVEKHGEYVDVVAHGDYKPVEGHRLSEGRGYGMVIAGIMQDRDLMDELIKSDKAVQNENGLSPWDIDEKDKVVDTTAATDGDEDMAYGAILADKLWGEQSDTYRTFAVGKINAIMTSLVEPDTFVLKPGDTWGGSHEGQNAVDPSYLRMAYYPLFKEYTGDAKWDTVAEVNFKIAQKSSDPDTGLVPDWTTTDGKAITDYPDKGHDFAWDAARYPIFLTPYALNSQDNAALTQLTKINQTLKADGPSEGSGRKLTGESLDPTPDTLFIAAGAVAALVDTDESYRKATLQTLIDTRGTYYEESVRLVSLAILSNKFLPS